MIYLIHNKGKGSDTMKKTRKVFTERFNTLYVMIAFINIVVLSGLVEVSECLLSLPIIILSTILILQVIGYCKYGRMD